MFFVVNKKVKNERAVKEFYALLFGLLFKGLREGVINRNTVDAITSFCLESLDEEK